MNQPLSEPTVEGEAGLDRPGKPRPSPCERECVSEGSEMSEQVGTSVSGQMVKASLWWLVNRLIATDTTVSLEHYDGKLAGVVHAVLAGQREACQASRITPGQARQAFPPEFHPS